MITPLSWCAIMKRFFPSEYVNIVHLLARWSTFIECGKQISNTNRPFESINDELQVVQADCAAKGMASASAGARRLRESMAGDHDSNTLMDAIKYLRTSLQDELNHQVFLLLEPGSVALAFEPHPFGEQVSGAFPTAAWDLEEAGRCLAFERYTAAVFHLGRVSEIVLVSIAERVGYKSPRPGFGDVLKYMDNHLAKTRADYEHAHNKFKGNIEFLSGVTAQMHAVNQAWRQRVSDLDRKYIGDEAQRIWDTTKALMQQLAMQVSEGHSS